MNVFGWEEKTLPSNRDNLVEGFEGFPVILMDFDDQYYYRETRFVMFSVCNWKIDIIEIQECLEPSQTLKNNQNSKQNLFYQHFQNMLPDLAWPETGHAQRVFGERQKNPKCNTESL